jgi:hypothetical protein
MAQTLPRNTKSHHRYLCIGRKCDLKPVSSTSDRTNLRRCQYFAAMRFLPFASRRSEIFNSVTWHIGVPFVEQSSTRKAMTCVWAHPNLKDKAVQRLRKVTLDMSKISSLAHGLRSTSSVLNCASNDRIIYGARRLLTYNNIEVRRVSESIQSCL